MFSVFSTSRQHCKGNSCAHQKEIKTRLLFNQIIEPWYKYVFFPNSLSSGMLMSLLLRRFVSQYFLPVMGEQVINKESPRQGVGNSDHVGTDLTKKGQGLGTQN